MAKTNFKTIWSAIDQSQNVLLHLHPGPDGDSVGSTLAMRSALRQLKKKVTLVSGDSPPPEYLSFLPGFKYIKNQPLQKTDLDQFDLFLILDSADWSMVSRNSFDRPSKLKTIVIDHHATNPRFGQINLVDTTSPATCQIIFQLLDANPDIKITKSMAANLITGLYTDTLFKYPGTTSQTFAIASKLTQIYPKFTDLIFQIENQNTKAGIEFEKILLNSIEEHGRLVMVSATYDQILNKEILPSDISGNNINNHLKSVVDWQVSVSLIEIQRKLIKLSFRTRDAKKYNVAFLAQDLGGGGHPAAAGATLSMTLPEAKDQLYDSVKKIYPDLIKPKK